MMQPRPYQLEAEEAAFSALCEPGKAPLIVLPTGTGKSFVCARLCQKIMTEAPNSRIIVATHTEHIIKQNYEELINLWRFAPVGIYSAGLGKKDYYRNITFAGIQSVAKKVPLFGKVDLLIIDEAHSIPKSGTGQWHKFIAGLKTANPELRILGLTATPYRLDTGCLWRGKGALFNEIAYEYSIIRAIDDGYLSPVVTPGVQTLFDVAGVTRGRDGEFKRADLEDAVNIDDKTQAACEEIISHGGSRKKWLIFVCGVNHATSVESYLTLRGVKCAAVSHGTGKADRRAIIQAFKDDPEFVCLINVDMFTTGFNVPGVDLIACLRATESTGLWVQMLGRGTRLAPGKTNCLVLDFTGNIERHGPIDKITPKDKTLGSGNGEAPIKQCPECYTFCYAGVKRCHSCHYEFPISEMQIQATASKSVLLSTQFQAHWFAVTDIFYSPHGANCMRVDYTCGKKVISDFVWQTGGKFNAWCKQHGIAVDTVEEALRSRKQTPVRICCVRNGKHWKVISRSFTL